jgi:hypothetical protein
MIMLQKCLLIVSQSIQKNFIKSSVKPSDLSLLDTSELTQMIYHKNIKRYIHTK